MLSRSKHKKPLEFSKLVLAWVMVTYFFGVLFVSLVIAVQVKRGAADIGTLVAALLSFIGAPTSVAIGWYLWKAKNENMQKYAQSGEVPAVENQEGPIS